jgi:hypothetical protein
MNLHILLRVTPAIGFFLYSRGGFAGPQSISEDEMIVIFSIIDCRFDL